jgi:hypothetical protein
MGISFRSARSSSAENRLFIFFSPFFGFVTLTAETARGHKLGCRSPGGEIRSKRSPFGRKNDSIPGLRVETKCHWHVSRASFYNEPFATL